MNLHVSEAVQCSIQFKTHTNGSWADATRYRVPSFSQVNFRTYFHKQRPGAITTWKLQFYGMWRRVLCAQIPNFRKYKLSAPAATLRRRQQVAGKRRYLPMRLNDVTSVRPSNHATLDAVRPNTCEHQQNNEGIPNLSEPETRCNMNFCTAAKDGNCKPSQTHSALTGNRHHPLFLPISTNEFDFQHS